MTANRVDCSELATVIAKIAFNIGSRPNVKSLDDVVAIMQEKIPEIRRESVVEAIVEAIRTKPRIMSEVSKKLSEIKKEARQDKRIRDRISVLEKLLQAKSLSKTQPKSNQATVAIRQLQQIRDDLNKQLRGSDPAKQQRLQKSIEGLIKKLKEGDYAPTIKKEALAENKELETLRYRQHRLRKEIDRRVENLKPKPLINRLANPLNLARAIMTSIDFSAVLRQGGFIAFGHPVRAAKSLLPMFKAAVSAKQSFKINNEIMERENAPLYWRAKLDLTAAGNTRGLSKKEEGYMSQWSEKIPLVAGSERAYVTFLNKLRADSFDSMVENLSKKGEPTQPEIEAIANYINAATGRGSLGSVERAAVALNTLFFAPKYVASRFQMLFGQPFYKGTTQTRKMIAKEYARYLTGLGAVIGLGVLAGATIEWDPRSSDFGKLKFGNTRLDIVSGFSQVAVLISRIITGKTKSSISGEVSAIRGDVQYGRDDTSDVLFRFARTKFAPIPGAAFDVASGTNVVGEPVTPGSVAKNLTTPLSLRDIYETMKEQGVPTGAALGLAAVFGFGLQTYKRKEKNDEISQIVNSVNKEGQKKGRKELPSVKLDDLLDKALRDI